MNFQGFKALSLHAGVAPFPLTACSSDYLLKRMISCSKQNPVRKLTQSTLKKQTQLFILKHAAIFFQESLSLC